MSDAQSPAAQQSAQVPAATQVADVAAPKKPRKPSAWNAFISAEKKGNKGRADFKALSQKYKEMKAATPSA